MNGKNNQRLMRYLLMKREVLMGNTLDSDELKFYNEIEAIYNNEPGFKSKIDLLLNADSMRKTNQILTGNYKEEKFTPYVEENDSKDIKENAIELPKPVEYDTEVSGGSEIAPSQAESSKVLVKVTTSKKAGYVDALVMALVTGFLGGVTTTILFILM